MGEEKGFGGRGASERILATATDLFARFGYNGVSTREIASVAKVNEATIFRHYSRKHDLYLAVMEAGLQQVHLRGDLLARIAEASDGQTALARTFELVAKTLLQKPEMLRLLQYSALEQGEDFDPLVRKYLSELIEVIARYLEPWIKNGELRGTNSKAFVFTLIAIVISYGPLKRVFAGERLGLDGMFGAYANFHLSPCPQQTPDAILRPLVTVD